MSNDNEILVTVAGASGSGTTMIGLIIADALAEAGINNVALVDGDHSEEELVERFNWIKQGRMESAKRKISATVTSMHTHKALDDD